DLPAPGDAGQDDGHQAGGHQRCGAARDVDADAAEGIEFLTHASALCVAGGPVSAKGFAAEEFDVLHGHGDGGAQRFISPKRGVEKLGFAHGELVGREFGAVEALGEFQERLVAARLDGLDDGTSALFDGRIEETRSVRQRAEALGKAGLRVPQHVHSARRLEDGEAKVKRGGDCLTLSDGRESYSYSYSYSS